MRQLAASRCDPAALTWSTFTEFARDLARIPVGTIFGRQTQSPMCNNHYAVSRCATGILLVLIWYINNLKVIHIFAIGG